MTYSTTMTQKGQITIPKEVRDAMNFKTSSKIIINFDPKQKKVTVDQAPDLFELAGTFKIKKRINVLKAREAMEKFYERT